MTDYQRILSYLYRYEKTEKRECPGFVKAEQKAGGLKLTIQIDDERLQQGMELKLCFYEKGEAGWQVWHLDSFHTQEQKEELHLIYSEDKLPKNFQIKGQSGIFLYYQEGFYYGSVWIGEAIPKEVLEPQRWHRVNTGEQSELELRPEQKQETGLKLKSEQKQETEPELKSEQRQEEEPEVRKKPKRMEESIIIADIAESPSMAGTMQEEVAEEDKSQDVEARNTTEGIEDASQEIDISEETEDIKVMDAAEDIDFVNDTENADIEEVEDSVDNFEKMWINSVKKKQPVDNIFNTAFYEGYKVSVEELRQIGKEAENLSGNQFLLKGYERYHHLLAGRVHYAGEKRYCIGVPGIYENREKYMAEIYQFPIFLSLTENRMKTGNFGYWLYLLSGNM